MKLLSAGKLKEKVMLDNLEKYQIILASNSPRRKELMSGLGIAYVVRTLPDVDESYPVSLHGEEIPLYISQKKAEAYLSSVQPNELIITADTIVWLDGKVYGKPKDAVQACAMLRELSGRTHQVITGVTLSTMAFRKSFAVTTHVTFSMLEEDEINYYVEQYKPFDKAGAYGVQEWIGFIGVTKLEGSFYNVMGLPIQRLYKELSKL